jgi:hypothetical protein
MSEKEKDRLIGTLVAVTTMIMGFLAVNYFGSFVTRAEYTEGYERLRINQTHIINDVKEIKEILHERR